MSDSFVTMWTAALPGSSVYGIPQAGILEWAAISFFRGIFPTWGTEPESPALEADSSPSEPPGKARVRRVFTANSKEPARTQALSPASQHFFQGCRMGLGEGGRRMMPRPSKPKAGVRLVVFSARGPPLASRIT